MDKPTEERRHLKSTSEGQGSGETGRTERNNEAKEPGGSAVRATVDARPGLWPNQFLSGGAVIVALAAGVVSILRVPGDAAGWVALIAPMTVGISFLSVWHKVSIREDEPIHRFLDLPVEERGEALNHAWRSGARRSVTKPVRWSYGLLVVSMCLVEIVALLSLPGPGEKLNPSGIAVLVLFCSLGAATADLYYVQRYLPRKLRAAWVVAITNLARSWVKAEYLGWEAEAGSRINEIHIGWSVGGPSTCTRHANHSATPGPYEMPPRKLDMDVVSVSEATVCVSRNTTFDVVKTSLNYATMVNRAVVEVDGKRGETKPLRHVVGMAAHPISPHDQGGSQELEVSFTDQSKLSFAFADSEGVDIIRTLQERLRAEERMS